MFRVKPRATLGLIFFTVLIQKCEKQWKVLRDCLKNLPMGISSGHQTFLRGCAPREILMTLGNSLGQIFPDNPYGLSTVCTRLPQRWPHFLPHSFTPSVQDLNQSTVLNFHHKSHITNSFSETWSSGERVQHSHGISSSFETKNIPKSQKNPFLIKNL